MSLRIPTPEDVRPPQDTRFKVGDTVYMNKKALEQQGMPAELLPENTALTVTRTRTSAYTDTPEYICDNNEGTYTLHETDLLPERMPEESTTTAAADAPAPHAQHPDRKQTDGIHKHAHKARRCTWLRLYNLIGKKTMAVSQNNYVHAVIDGQTVYLAPKHDAKGRPYLVPIEMERRG